MSEVLKQFHEIAESPKTQLDRYLAAGKKVVGIAPVYTPQEIIHSMGLVPMGVWGTDIQLNASKEYFPAFICAIVQSVLELGIKGAYQGMSALVIPSLCDSLKTLGQNWKYAVKDIPFIPMTYPQNRKPDFGIKFTRAGYQRVIDDLQKVTGAKFDDTKLAESVRIYNRHNAVMREFEEVASTAKISAGERRDVFKSAWFMLPEEHTALVEKLIAELKAGPQDDSKARVLVSGVLADVPALLDIFDRNGLKIAWDDVAAESRQYFYDTPETSPALDALAVKFANMDNCSVLYDSDKKRVDFLVDNARKHNAKGVIVLLTKFCDPEEFDYVPVRKACDAAGIPVVNIEIDRQMAGYEQAATMIQAFAEML